MPSLTDFLSRFPDPYENYRLYPTKSKTPPSRPPYRPPSPPSTLDDLSHFYRSAKKRLLYNMREIDPCISEYTHMQDMPESDQALHHLRKLASCVKPIMRKRGWRVGTLSEFYPEQKNLLGLNVNRGQSILVRLRHPNDRSKFMTFEATLDTMLHELCHIVRGPHDGEFHKLWDELRNEWEALSVKGYTGEGFLSKGYQVGGSLIPREEMRRRARLEAAKRDQQRQADRKKQGHRVGGSRPVPGYAPKDAAAAATLRRITAVQAGSSTVTEGCGTGTKAGAQAAADALLNGFRTKEEMDEANAIAIQQAAIELMTQEEEQALDRQHRTRQPVQPMSDGLVWDPINGLQAATPPPANMLPVPSKSAPPKAQSSSYHPPHVPIHSKPSASKAPTPPLKPKPNNKTYETYHPNRPISRVVKEAEEKQRQKKLLKKGGSSSPSSRPIPNGSSSVGTWQCEICTLINSSNISRCGACEIERPSHPTSAHRSVSVPPPVSNDNPFSNFKDMGWSCMWCGNYMEKEWWTCSICGKMKDAS